MDLSVVVPTLNGRERLVGCLDAIAEHAPDAEHIVVNGPSADGTSGLVQDRADVDVLVEVSSRNANVARNAGIEVAGGDVVAFVGFDLCVCEEWLASLTDGLAEAAVVTGPTHRALATGVATETPERTRFRGREVDFFNGRNVAFRAGVLDTLDGFDEYLETGGDRDAAHRLAGLGYPVTWRAGMSVRQEAPDEHRPDGPTYADGTTDWRWTYRARAYCLVKNYGLRPSVAGRLARCAVGDGFTAAHQALRGEGTATGWLANGRDVLAGIATGLGHGAMARARDRTASRNPHGVSARRDRAVARYDRRERNKH